MKLIFKVFTTMSLLTPTGESLSALVETTGRKYIGKNSFLLRRENDRLEETLSPEALGSLLQDVSRRNPGSKYFWRGYKQWSTPVIEAIRHDLSLNLPLEADKEAFENLFFRLGIAADHGIMPSFEDAGARSGYALQFFCRARGLADLFIKASNPSKNDLPEFWTEALIVNSPIFGGKKHDEETYNVVSIGGGPAYDFVAVALAATYCSGGTLTTQMHTTILDYEEGWADLCHAMSNSTQNILPQSQLSCSWGGKCDITSPLTHSNNVACLSEIQSADLWICQYCVAENARLLRGSKLLFFKEVFEHSKDGSLFVITETTTRLWPDFYKMVKEYCPYMQMGFSKNGKMMVLYKGGLGKSILNEHDLQKLEEYEKMAAYHRRKVESGFQRQERKRRGSKASTSI